MTELQADQVLTDLAAIQLQLADIADWSGQITTHLYFFLTVIFPLVGACMVLWWVLKRYMY